MIVFDVVPVASYCTPGEAYRVEVEGAYFRFVSVTRGCATFDKAWAVARSTWRLAADASPAQPAPAQPQQAEAGAVVAQLHAENVARQADDSRSPDAVLADLEAGLAEAGALLAGDAWHVENRTLAGDVVRRHGPFARSSRAFSDAYHAEECAALGHNRSRRHDDRSCQRVHLVRAVVALFACLVAMVAPDAASAAPWAPEFFRPEAAGENAATMAGLGLVALVLAAAVACGFSFLATWWQEEGGCAVYLPAPITPRLPRVLRARRLRLPALPHVSRKRVGGLRFVKVGRLTVSWCIARDARPLR